MTAPADFTAVAAAVASDTQQVVSRIAALKTELEAVLNLAHGIAAATGSAVPTPAAPSGTLSAAVVVVPASEGA